MVFSGFKLKDSVYNILKWICLIVLPAVSTFYSLLADVWNLPYATQIPTTINGIAVLIGTIIGISHLTIKAEEDNDLWDKE
jgi:hypothetical protein